MGGVLWAPLAQPQAEPEFFPSPSGEGGKWVSCQVWSALGQGPMDTSHWTAQHWSMPYWLALRTQPRDNGAIHTAWALHNDPLGLSP